MLEASYFYSLKVGKVIPIRTFLAICIFAYNTKALSEVSNFGTTGLINIPSAYMQEDAIFTPSIASSDNYDYFSLTYQAFPILETTFRYRKVKDVENSAWPDYYDRNFAAKLKLRNEDFYLPAVSIGSRDFVGTGLVGSEYLVATKQWNRFQFTIGLGWGDLAGDSDLKNPLTYLSEKFSDRGDGFVNGREPDQAGQIPLDSLFQGENIGIFGGLSYKFRKLPLEFMIEYNPEYNRTDVLRFELDKPASPISYGLRWLPNRHLTVTAGVQHSTDASLNFSYRFQTNKQPKKGRIQFRDLRQLNKTTDIHTNWYSSLLRDMENSGLLLLEGSLTGNEETAQLKIGNLQFANWNQALELATSLADLHLPTSVKNIEFTLEEGGYTAKNVHFPRPTHKVLVEELDSIRIYPTETKPANVYTLPDYATDFVQSKIAFEFGPVARVQLFDPDDPFRYGFGLGVGTTIALPNNWVLRSYYTHLLEHNFDESARRSDSILPHVRTDIVDYLNDSDRLQALYFEKRTSSSNNVHWRQFAGILEEMFMGIGGEFLYHPFNSRLAFGASYAWVAQRSSESDFETRDYNVFTGFVSAYWDAPIFNYDIALHLGQYLAKDKGATLEFTRTFHNGWRVGAWATLTNVSSEDFGEGSFDKGIYLKIPISLAKNKSTRKSIDFTIRPTQRDGGQQLDGFVGSIWKDRNNIK